MKMPNTLQGLPSTKWAPIDDVPFMPSGKSCTLPQVLWNKTSIFYYLYRIGWFHKHPDPRIRAEAVKLYEWSKNVPLSPTGFLWEYQTDSAGKFVYLKLVLQDEPVLDSRLINRSATLDLGFAVPHGNGSLNSYSVRQFMSDLRHVLSGKPASQVRKEQAEKLCLNPIPIAPLVQKLVLAGLDYGTGE